jgi:hypothetical protein
LHACAYEQNQHIINRLAQASLIRFIDHAMLLLCCCYAAAMLLLCCCYAAAMLLLCAAAMLLLFTLHAATLNHLARCYSHCTRPH